MNQWPSRYSWVLLVLLLVLVGCGKKSGPSIVGNNGDNNGENNGMSVLRQAGDPCETNDQCESTQCVFQKCTDAVCNDGIKNGAETDVDCGALGCNPCNIGGACELDGNCISGICEGGQCVESRCADNDQNGLETDVDCGGLFCDPCDDGNRCQEGTDCVSMVCDDTCQTPTCDDSTMNGTETDVDCGGPCEPCGDGSMCEEAADCVSGVCTGGVCQEPNCMDSVHNANETDVDCGGNTCNPCGDGEMCGSDRDCTSLLCSDTLDTCDTPSCTDGKKNGIETDVDCGGNCPFLCSPNKDCLVNADCASNICSPMFKCTTPACDDFTRNGDETDIDCGGPRCGGCLDNRMCAENSDCLSVVCGGGTCQMSQCSDGAMNGNETDVDCGGTCNKCADGDTCGVAADCLSGVCQNTCRAPRCNDGVQNGTETDVDCGGDTCNACIPGQSCVFGTDCDSFVCNSLVCSMPTCFDQTQNGTETDVDCGSNCPKCGIGETCSMDIDCGSDICDGGMAGPICAVCDERATQLLTTPCGFGNRGRVQQTCTEGFWQNSGCDGVWYASCKEILDAGVSTGDGQYDIDPDGPAAVYTEFSVFCDMTTDGGGWTEIAQCDAQNKLNGVMVAINVASTETAGACKPTTQDGTGEHAYHYTFDFPAGFSQFYLNQYEIKANAKSPDTSDLGFIQISWSVPAGNNRGDVSFGSGSSAGPVTSLSRFAGSQSCLECVYPWPDGNTRYNLGSTSTKFRIGWGEQGPESEGWIPWWEGTIRLR